MLSAAQRRRLERLERMRRPAGDFGACAAPPLDAAGMATVARMLLESGAFDLVSDYPPAAPQTMWRAAYCLLVPPEDREDGADEPLAAEGTA